MFEVSTKAKNSQQSPLILGSNKFKPIVWDEVEILFSHHIPMFSYPRQGQLPLQRCLIPSFPILHFPVLARKNRVQDTIDWAMKTESTFSLLWSQFSIAYDSINWNLVRGFLMYRIFDSVYKVLDSLWKDLHWMLIKRTNTYYEIS